MENGKSAVADMINNCNKIQIITDAVELLDNGFPLDDETKTALGTIGVDYVEFIRRFEIQAT